jgi:hypothetical protein
LTKLKTQNSLTHKTQVEGGQVIIPLPQRKQNEEPQQMKGESLGSKGFKNKLGREILSFFFFFSRDRVSLCSLGCPGTHSVDQADLELRDPPASASQVLGLKACTTMPGRVKILDVQAQGPEFKSQHLHQEGE